MNVVWNTQQFNYSVVLLYVEITATPRCHETREEISRVHVDTVLQISRVHFGRVLQISRVHFGRVLQISRAHVGTVLQISRVHLGTVHQWLRKKNEFAFLNIFTLACVLYC